MTLRLKLSPLGSEDYSHLAPPESSPNIANVDAYAAYFSGEKDKLLENRIEHTRQRGTLISQINTTDKCSANYSECLGVAATGTYRGIPVSFLSHSYPSDDGISEEGLGLIKQRVDEMQSLCDSGSTNFGIFGGIYIYNGIYRNAVMSIAQQLPEGNTRVLTGPNIFRSRGGTNAYLNTSESTLTLKRPQQPNTKSSDRGYLPCDIESQVSKWKEDFSSGLFPDNKLKSTFVRFFERFGVFGLGMPYQ